jgi:maltose alpha-D-glucosyltransferase/alpha-amylase
MHVALASPTSNPDFAPEPLTDRDVAAIREDLTRQAGLAFDALKGNLSKLPEEVDELAGLVLSRRRAVVQRLVRFSLDEATALRTRIHGDYHLGQVLRAKGDFVILDFEGEPARTLAERRTKQSPMKDVAGMLRSFSYAAYTGLLKATTRRPTDRSRLEPWSRLWEHSVSGAFLHAYREATQGSDVVPAETESFRRLLEVYMLDKALYELVYELNNRPSWVRIPLSGILEIPF